MSEEINKLRNKAMALQHEMRLARDIWAAKRSRPWIGWLVARPAWKRYVKAARLHRDAQREFLVAFATKCSIRLERFDV